jgi:hypothetical protein
MLEILFVALPVVALVAALALFFSVIKKDKEYTITLNIESEDILHPKMSTGANAQVPTSLTDNTSEPIAKPKRRYKKRKKKASPVSSPVAPPVAEVVPAVKKRVGRPKKTT